MEKATIMQGDFVKIERNHSKVGRYGVACESLYDGIMSVNLSDSRTAVRESDMKQVSWHEFLTEATL